MGPGTAFTVWTPAAESCRRFRTRRWGGTELRHHTVTARRGPPPGSPLLPARPLSDPSGCTPALQERGLSLIPLPSSGDRGEPSAPPGASPARHPQHAPGGGGARRGGPPPPRATATGGRPLASLGAAPLRLALGREATAAARKARRGGAADGRPALRKARRAAAAAAS